MIVARDPEDSETFDMFDLPPVKRGITPVTRRLIDAADLIRGEPPEDIAYQHTVFCQTGLPYQPTDARVWEREQGIVSLSVEAGRARDPVASKWVDVPLPHGEKPRLILMHLNSEALRTGNPVVEVESSMTGFVKSLGLETHGRNIKTIKEQLARLSAATVRLAVTQEGRAIQVDTKIVGAFDLWFPKDETQRVLWPSTVRLSQDYYDSLTRHAVPLDARAIGALAHSALALDVYAWLAQRLHRIPPNRPQTITWLALKAQFGPEYERLRDFRRKFLGTLGAVQAVYGTAKVEANRVGVVLRNSLPPVPKRFVAGVQLLPSTDNGA
jgi:hypothetical protein